MLPDFALARPTTVAGAVALLSEEKLAYCGGTELLLAMKMGLLRPEALIDLKGIDELRGVVRRDDRLLIGAGTAHADIEADPLVREHLPLLVEVERKVGNARVRTQGSIGGNVCFAEPRSDVTTVLSALGATFQLASPAGRREVAVGDFLQGPYWTDRQDNELLVSIDVPIPRTPLGTYLKFQTTERPTVGVALVADADGGAYRLAVGAVGELPAVFDYADLAEIDARDVAEQVDPVPDLTGTERYKRHVTAVYVERAVAAFTAEQLRRER